MDKNTVLLITLLCVAPLVAAPAMAAQGTNDARKPAAPCAPIATHDLERGVTLTAADVRWGNASDTSTTAVCDNRTTMNPDSMVTAGWTTRRFMRTGEVLGRPSVAPPPLVAAGASVDVIYHTTGVSLTVHGVAIEGGSHGDIVYVKLENRKRLRGIVAGVNTVQVL